MRGGLSPSPLLYRPSARRSAPGLCRLPSLKQFRRGDERLLECPLELRPPEWLHHVTCRPELTSFVARTIDAHAQDRQLRKTTSHAAGEPYARARRRFQQQEVGLFAVDPFTRADRGVAESKAKKLEQRPRRGVWIDDEDGRHRGSFGRARGNGGCPWYERGMSVGSTELIRERSHRLGRCRERA